MNTSYVGRTRKQIDQMVEKEYESRLPQLLQSMDDETSLPLLEDPLTTFAGLHLSDQDFMVSFFTRQGTNETLHALPEGSSMQFCFVVQHLCIELIVIFIKQVTTFVPQALTRRALKIITTYFFEGILLKLYIFLRRNRGESVTHKRR
jgi:hypothetical protein